MSDSQTVPHLWAHESKMPSKLVIHAYATCERGKEGRCIVTNLTKAAAKYLKRPVRAVQTRNGHTYWSECVNGEWFRYRAPLKVEYARMVDAFDREGKHFKAPTKAPFGSVELVEKCIPNPIQVEAQRTRTAAYKKRIDSGKLVPRARFRALQTAAAEQAAA